MTIPSITKTIPSVTKTVPAVTQTIRGYVIPDAVAPLSTGRFIVLCVAVAVASACVGGLVGAWLAIR